MTWLLVYAGRYRAAHQPPKPEIPGNAKGSARGGQVRGCNTGPRTRGKRDNQARRSKPRQLHELSHQEGCVGGTASGSTGGPGWRTAATVNAGIQEGFHRPGKLSPAVPREESGWVLRDWRMWGAILGLRNYRCG